MKKPPYPSLFKVNTPVWLTELSEGLGKKATLDEIPDHPRVIDHPEYFLSGTEEDLTNSPQNYTRVTNKKKDLIVTYGRHPYFVGWPDAVHLTDLISRGLHVDLPARGGTMCLKLEVRNRQLKARS